MTVEATTFLAISGVATHDLATLTGSVAGAPPSTPHMVAATTSTSTDDNAIKEPEVIMGHPGLRMPGTVSLSEAMGTTHFVLNQAHDVLRRETEDINEERIYLSVWVSMLKQRTASEKEKAEERRKYLNVMEVMYRRRQAVADKLDPQTQKLLHDAKELYAMAEARVNATIK
jgi:hypothetical protein